MPSELSNHLWQSTIFALAAGLLTIVFRRNRAQVRYWLWLSASIKFLVPFSLLIALGSRLEWPAQQVSPARYSAPLVEIAQPFADTVPFLTPAAPKSPDWVPLAVFGLWACGFAAIVLMRLRGWLRVRAAVRASAPLEIPVPVDVRSAPGLLEPGVVGFVRPILLLPEGIAECLTPRQLEAVLAHELCHVRRRDNLTSAIHMIVEAVFWFHPLVWWIGARLVDERERACDEAVLSLGNEPQVYAEGILNVCKIYTESPLRCVSGVTGSDLKKRIQAILTGRVAANLNFAKRAALAVAALAALVLPVLVGILNAPAVRAQSPATPKFEVASIRRCRDLDGVVGRGGGGGVIPGRLSLNCQSVAVLINAAYAIFANGRLNFPPSIRIEGGPDWINSERYTINAKPEGTPSPAVIQGPMLQALLEQRFKLKVQRETREVPIYELTVDKGGVKMPRHKEGSCVLVPPVTSGGPPPRPTLPPGEKYCTKSGAIRGPNVVIDAQGMSIEEFAKTFLAVAQPWIQQWAGRPVIDKTGLTKTFDFHLEYALDEEFRTRLAAEGQDPGEPTAPSIFTALQEQLGLKLESAKGLGEFVIIDSVARPSEN